MPFQCHFPNILLSDGGSWGSDRLVCSRAFTDVASGEGQLSTHDVRCSVGRQPWLVPSGTDDLSGLTSQSYDVRTVKAVIIGDLGVEPPWLGAQDRLAVCPNLACKS